MKLNVDFTNVLGPIKAMHAVGQPPMVGNDDRQFRYLKEAGVPYSRLHDTGGRYGCGCYVDIPNIFRDFEADENDPASYDFAFTDWLLEALDKVDCKPIYRLGVTIENYPHIKTYYIHPPKDFDKWARICEHIIRHYNEGWANGFHYGIEYWEIWNEPDSVTGNGSMMWTGTRQQYFDLYRTAATHLKTCFGDSIKVGGFASCGFYGLRKHSPAYDEFMDYYLAFLAFVRDNRIPLDFFSWHSYADVEFTGEMADYVEKTLTEYGFGHIETQLNEWNNAADRYLRGTAVAAARAAAMMLHMQNKPTTMLCYYDARIGFSQYGGMFDGNTWDPVCLYYVFKAFNELYQLGNQVPCHWEQPGVYAVAATGETGKAVMMTNVSDHAVEVECDAAKGMTVYLVDDNHKLEIVDWNSENFTLEVNQTVLLK